MEPNHNTPEEAFRAFRDSKAKIMIPMHYGTFDQSDEPAGEPLRRLKRVADEEGDWDTIRPLDINESVLFD
jgi:L-ascorbate metabolism protein UlaG (beta-lactamase superfamily)